MAGKGTLRAPVIHDCGVLSPGSPGLLAPAEPVATLTLDGDLLEATSTFIADITAAGHDVAHVTGDAALWLVEVHVAAGFTPAPTQSFIIISGRAVSGTFGNLEAGRVSTADNKGSFSVTIGTETVTIGDYRVGAPAGVLTFAAWRGAAAYFTTARICRRICLRPRRRPRRRRFTQQPGIRHGNPSPLRQQRGISKLVRDAAGALFFTWSRAKTHFREHHP